MLDSTVQKFCGCQAPVAPVLTQALPFTAIFKLKLAKQAAQHRHYYRITLPKSRKRSQLNSAAMSLPLRSEQ